MEAKKGQRRRTLYRLNVAACILHGLSFTAALVVAIIFAPGSFLATLTTTFWKAGGPFLDVIANYQIIWLELAFPLITSIFHGVIAFSPRVREQYFRWVFQGGKNPLRWLEYAITASIMTWVLMQVSAVTDLLTVLVVGVIGNIVLQAQGYLMEELNPPKAAKINWVPTWIGWILFMGQWTVIAVNFFVALANSVEPVPWFVYTIVIGLFFQFASFGFVQLGHYLGWPRFLKSNYNEEIAFIVLSFVSKFFLDWTLLIGIATNMMA